MKRDAARPTPIADAVRAIAAWYVKQTGLAADRYANARVLSILLYLEKTGLTLGDVRMQVATDPMWTSRGNRTEAEAGAELVGRTSSAGRTPQYWYVVPNEPQARKATPL